VGLQVSRAASKQRCVDLLRQTKEAKPCHDCGMYFPYYVLHFDHRPGTVKLGDCARIALSGAYQMLIVEMAKCDIVCANCHAIRTHNRRHNIVPEPIED
jgi:hypothetical protein